jgi:glycosyltransferase involved in cell wall biosynthesis
MTTPLPAAPATPRGAAGVVAVEVVLPVHNEARHLGPRLRRLHRHLAGSFPYPFRITIVDNASSDASWPLARRLADELGRVRAVHVAAKGRGGAVRAVWAASDAAVLAYMDADLSTDLAALPPLVAPLLSGHADLAIGTRLGRGARVVRGLKREVISRGYNLLLHVTLETRVSDAQCGFKALTAAAARLLLPQVEDDGWFFDTELLVRAERAGLRIHEVPVAWVEDPDSSVALVPTALADLRGVARLVRAVGGPGRPPGRRPGHAGRTR